MEPKVIDFTPAVSEAIDYLERLIDHVIVGLLLDSGQQAVLKLAQDMADIDKAIAEERKERNETR